MDMTVAALLVTLIIDIISKVRATKAENESTKKVAEAVGKMEELAGRLQEMHSVTLQRLTQLEDRVDFIEKETGHGRSGSWRH